MMKAKVAIIDQPNVETGIIESLDNLGTISKIFQGKHVAIKPNDTWASEEDKTACTQPEALRTVVRYVKKNNPAKITITGGAGAGETDEIFAILGLDKVIEEENVEFFDHNREPFEEVLLNSGPQPKVIINPYVLEYETLISLNQLKVHGSAGVTLTMKNIAMSYPAADYYGHPRSHQKKVHNFFDNLHDFIAAMCARFRIDLGIITGYPTMIGRGPIGGKIFNSGLTVASTDIVAADKIGAEILGRGDTVHIKKAAELGIGIADLKDIECAPLSLDKAIELFNQRKEEYLK